jgi:Mg2+ and Co2+ transporter CorA
MLEGLLASPEQITFAVLFVGLLVYVMKTNDAREKQYRETIDRLTTAVSTVNHIEKKVNKISSTLGIYQNKKEG